MEDWVGAINKKIGNIDGGIEKKKRTFEKIKT